MFFKGFVLIALAVIIHELAMIAITLGPAESQIVGALIAAWVGLLAVGVLYLLAGALWLLRTGLKLQRRVRTSPAAALTT
jgi:hypothetical protein